MFELSQVIVLIGLLANPVFGSSSKDQGSSKTIVAAIDKLALKVLKAADAKYQKEQGIHMKVEKTITLAMLGSQKQSFGEIWLDKGQMRFEVHKPQKSKIIAGKEYLWIETAPPEGFEGVKTQVVQASLSSDQAKSQGLIQLLTTGGLQKYFKVTGVQKAGSDFRYFLQPKKTSVELKRAQVLISSVNQSIKELKYWDQLDNQTQLVFKSPKFKQKVDGNLFKYKAPKGAEVITY